MLLSPSNLSLESKDSGSSTPFALRLLKLPTLQWKVSGSPTSIVPSESDPDLESGDMRTPLSPPELEKEPSDTSNESLRSLMDDHLVFVRRVCGLLALQVLLSAVLSTGSSKFLHFATRSGLGKLDPRFVMLTVLVILGLIVVMSCCCRHAAQKAPMSIFCLLLVTILESAGFGVLMTVWEVQTVLVALCLVVIVLGVLICYYTFFTAGSFNTAGPYLLAVWAVVGFWPPIMCFLTDGQIPQRAAVGIMVLLFCLHVICDLQSMVRKAHRGYNFTTSEHIFAVVSIYLDVVTPTSPLCD